MSTAVSNGHRTTGTTRALAPLQPPVPPTTVLTTTVLTTTEALDHAVCAATMAVAETEKILMDAIAARAHALVDAACEEIDKAKAAAEQIGEPGKGDEALRTIEYCVTRAAQYEREAKRRHKEYCKLAAKHGRGEALDAP